MHNGQLVAPGGHQNSIAIKDVSSGREISYSELFEICSQGGHYTVALALMDGTAASILGYLWAIENSRVTMVVGADLDQASLMETINQFSVELVVSSEESLRLSGFHTAMKLEGLVFAAQTGPAAPNTSLEPQILLSTSGSSGKPKFARLATEGVIRNASDIAEALKLSPDDVAPTVLPTSYAYGLSVVNSVLFAGGRLICGRFDALSPSFRQILIDEHVTHLPGVPFHHEMYNRVGIFSDPPSSLRTVTQAGGKLSAEKVRAYSSLLRSSGAFFVPMYGQTEATARIAIMPRDLVEEFPTKVGHSVLSGKIQAGTSSLEAEEIRFQGPNVMMGYAEAYSDLRRPDQLKGRLATGDLGYLDSFGLLEVTGRLKRLSKLSNGMRINLDEVETALSAFGVCAVVDLGGKLGIIFEGGKPHSSVVSDTLESFRLLDRDFVTLTIESIPRLSSGKVDYIGLGEML